MPSTRSAPVLSNAMNILGISAFYHDSAACLVQDGRIVAAAEEERFSRKKHDHDFPREAIAYCARQGGIDLRELDFVVFYDKPLLKFDRLLETYIGYAPSGFNLFRVGLPLWLQQKLRVRSELDRGLGCAYQGRYLFTEHHEAHAASAFFPSPFDEAAILTLDGVGEWTTASIGVGRGNTIEMRKELRFPHSLGLLYSAFTYFAGFQVNDGEYKLMGLAPYGEPIYRDRILKHLIDLRADGSFRLNMEYFAYCSDQVMTSVKMNELLDGPPKAPASAITQREMNLAASIQAVTEEIVMRIARYAHAVTGMNKLVLAGGVALNCVANGKLLREGPFDDLWIQPAASDAGGALGAALFVFHQLLDRPRESRCQDAQQGSLLGPRYSDAETRAYLDSVGAVYHHYDDETSLCERVAELLAREQVVGHVEGRMEFGPRALGGRSILGDARSPHMQSVLNRKIKFRESFRPFAPAVLREQAHTYFELNPGQESPYMLLTASVRADKLLDLNDGDWKGLDRSKQVRSCIPAVTHVDCSARIQTVDEHRNRRFHGILSAFMRRTGCPVVINTSFNVRDEPIVNTPTDAYRCFMATDMDALVIERCLLLKKEQCTPESLNDPGNLAISALDTRSQLGMRSLFRLKLHPDERTLQEFGLTALVAFGMLAGGVCFHPGKFFGNLGTATIPVAIVCLAVALVSALFTLIYPNGNRPLYLLLTVISYPIGLITSEIVLALLFFGIFTPIGVAMRARARDPLQRDLDPSRPSYWLDVSPRRNRASYFNQY